MEKLSKRQINMCKEDLGIPFGSGSHKDKKKNKKDNKKKIKKTEMMMIQWQMRNQTRVVQMKIKVIQDQKMKMTRIKFHSNKKCNSQKK